MSDNVLLWRSVEVLPCISRCRHQIDAERLYREHDHRDNEIGAIHRAIVDLEMKHTSVGRVKISPLQLLRDLWAAVDPLIWSVVQSGFYITFSWISSRRRTYRAKAIGTSDCLQGSLSTARTNECLRNECRPCIHWLLSILPKKDDNRVVVIK